MHIQSPVLIMLPSQLVMVGPVVFSSIIAFFKSKMVGPVVVSSVIAFLQKQTV
jgi:hypothetical protein